MHIKNTQTYYCFLFNFLYRFYCILHRKSYKLFILSLHRFFSRKKNYKYETRNLNYKTVTEAKKTQK